MLGMQFIMLRCTGLPRHREFQSGKYGIVACDHPLHTFLQQVPCRRIQFIDRPHDFRLIIS